MDIVGGMGRGAGAVYVVVALTLAVEVGATTPQAAPLQPDPVTVQLTVVLLLFETFAAIEDNDCVAATTGTGLAGGWVIKMVTAGPMVTLATPNFEESAVSIART
jgi:hypothetical protein